MIMIPRQEVARMEALIEMATIATRAGLHDLSRECLKQCREIAEILEREMEKE